MQKQGALSGRKSFRATWPNGEWGTVLTVISWAPTSSLSGIGGERDRGLIGPISSICMQDQQWLLVIATLVRGAEGSLPPLSDAASFSVRFRTVFL
jgi:hypothetical protein